MTKNILISATALMLQGMLGLAAQESFAQQFERLGDVDVHYAVVNTTFLDPDVAAAYDITRGKRRAMLNISVLNGTTGKPRKALVSGSVRELINAQTLDFREIQENNAIYYIAEFHILDRQLHRFDLQVQLSADEAPLRLKFEQKVYAD